MDHVYLKPYDVIVHLKILTFPIVIGRILGPWFQISTQKVEKKSSFDEKSIIPLILVKYCLNRWSPWQQGHIYT